MEQLHFSKLNCQLLEETTKASQVPLTWPEVGPLLNPIHPNALRATALSFPWKTSAGCDLHPRWFAYVSDSALGWLSLLYSMSEFCGGMPLGRSRKVVVGSWAIYLVTIVCTRARALTM